MILPSLIIPVCMINAIYSFTLLRELCLMYGIYLGGLKLTPSSCLVFFLVSFISIAYLWIRLSVFYSTSVFSVTHLQIFDQLSCIFTQFLVVKLKNGILFLINQIVILMKHMPISLSFHTIYASLIIINISLS